ncbi:hypothetical protein D3C87_1753200 [compost metagenome]
MEAIGFRLQIGEGRLVAFVSLDAQERGNDGAAGFASLDHFGHRGRFLAQGGFHFSRQLDLVELLGQAAMVVHVALRHATPVKALGDDRVRDTEPEQLGVL